MVNNEVILTKEGFEKLEAELKELKGPRRKEIAEKIKVAREFGDLSENAEYDEAKNEQAQNEDRIMVIEEMLMNASTIDEDSLDEDKVHIGSKVRVYDIEYKEEMEYKIVGSAEADPLEGKISNTSPVGEGLLGGKVGDRVKVDTPSGVIELEIKSISV